MVYTLISTSIIDGYVNILTKNVVLVKAVLIIIIKAGYCYHSENNQIRLFKITIEVYKRKYP